MDHNNTDHVIQWRIRALTQSANPPELLAIASCDGDFAPIAQWLKAKGIQTLCIATSPDRTARRSKEAFQDTVYLDHSRH